ncbi:hypothetical protein [Acinetobacter sp. BWR-L5]|uniref:hypothetical protein n=1 Tax=Acinetobacter sp. BWR-L5 TaxID=2815725 RepID=UPI0031FED21F
MKLIVLILRLTTLMLLLPINVHAGLAIPMGITTSDSIHTFPETLKRDFWEKLGIKAEAKGTAFSIDEPGIGGNSSKFNYPVTSIVIGPKMKIILGRAKGTVMVYSRTGEDGNLKSLTLSNFSIDYTHKNVLADATYDTDKKLLQLPIFTFSIETPLTFKYRFPIGFKSYEKLTHLYLTAEAKLAYKEAFGLPDAAIPLLDMDFGTLTQSSSSKIRLK